MEATITETPQEVTANVEETTMPVEEQVQPENKVAENTVPENQNLEATPNSGDGEQSTAADNATPADKEGEENKETLVTRLAEVQKVRGALSTSLNSLVSHVIAIVDAVTHRTETDLTVLTNLHSTVEGIRGQMEKAEQYCATTVTKDAFAREKFRTSAEYIRTLEAWDKVIETQATLGVPFEIPGYNKEEKTVSPEVFETMYQKFCTDPNKGNTDTMPINLQFTGGINAQTGGSTLSTKSTGRTAGGQAVTQTAAKPEVPSDDSLKGTSRQKYALVDRANNNTIYPTSFNGLWSFYCEAHPDKCKEAPSTKDLYAVTKSEWGRANGIGASMLREWAATQTLADGTPRFGLAYNPDKKNPESKYTITDLIGTVDGKAGYLSPETGAYKEGF